MFEEVCVDVLWWYTDLQCSNHLYAIGKKCEIGKSKVAYLGDIISNKGVMVDQEKIKAISDWPLPKNLKELGGFLGWQAITGIIQGYA